MSDKKILFLLYNYPPEYGTAPKRNFRLSDTIKDAFSDYHIITSKKKNREYSEKITEINPLDYRYFLRKTTSTGTVPEALKKNNVSHFFIKILNTIPFNILFGEGGGIYMYKNYLKAKSLIKSRQFTHIYSSYRPATDHLVARALKRSFPGLVWIADFRDLIVDPHYKQQFFPKLHQRIYTRIFASADVLISISAPFANALKRYNPNTIAIPNGVDINLVQINPVPYPYFTIVYTGSMFLNERNAEPLFQAVKHLIEAGKIDNKSVRIIYAGKDSGEWEALSNKYNCKEIFINKGLVNSEDTIKLQRQANINVLLTISSDKLQGVLTGKLVEYLEAGSPVLAIVKGQNDPILSEMINELNAGMCVSDDSIEGAAIANFIAREYNEWLQTGRNSRKMNREILYRKYSTHHLLQPLMSYLN
jgi:hypothetical protein